MFGDEDCRDREVGGDEGGGDGLRGQQEQEGEGHDPAIIANGSGFAGAQHGGGDARVAAGMEDGENPERSFLVGIGDEVVSDEFEADWERSEIGAKNALARMTGECSHGLEESLANPPRHLNVVVSDVLPDVLNIVSRFRMEPERLADVHLTRLARSFSSLRRSDSKKASPSIDSTREDFRSS